VTDDARVGQALTALEAWFGAAPGAIVAYSGGVDSALVAFLGRHWLGAARSVAVISASPSLKASDLEAARAFASAHAIPLEVIVTSELENPDYARNPADRCYHCKHTLYAELEHIRARHPDWWILNGQNADDLGDYRPGIRAATQHGVRAPLAECGIDKPTVRAIAAAFSLDCHDKPASPCLASRIPYGESVTFEKMRRIEAAEALLLDAGFRECRVRHRGGTACIEVPAAEIDRLQARLSGLAEAFATLGFERTEIDPEGLVSGKLNRVLPHAH